MEKSSQPKVSRPNLLNLNITFGFIEIRSSDMTKEVEGRLLAQQDALLLVKDSLKVNLEDLNSRVTDLSAQSEETQGSLTAL